MEYNKDLFPTEEVPDYAMQPAKQAEAFDPSVYDRLYANMTPAASPPPQEQEEVAEPMSQETAADVMDVPTEEVVALEEAETSEPVLQDAIPVSLPKATTTKIQSAGRNLMQRNVHYTDFRKLAPVKIYIEEDVLVPDVKPDLERILCLDGKCRLSERNVNTGNSGIQALRISGDLHITVLYAAKDDRGPCIQSVETRIPFRDDCAIEAMPNSFVTLTCHITDLEHETVNERKFRVKATVQVCPREYCTQDLNMLCGIDDSDVETLEDRICMTDVAFRRTETAEVSEDLKLKDGAPAIDQILGYQVHVAENHKQISREKAAINATVLCNVVYQGEERPEFYQGKTEFTQFIKLDDDNAFTRPLTGSRVNFQLNNISLTPKRDEEGKQTILGLDMDVDTTVEYYRELEEPVVKDLYHHTKDVYFDTKPVDLMHFCGNGSTEATVREIISLPDRFGSGYRVVYLTGCPIVKRETVEQGRCIVEGTFPVKLACLSGEPDKTPFSMEQDLDFRAAMDLPDCKAGMKPDATAFLKELWFDPINSRQVEVNATIAVSANVFSKGQTDLIETVSFLEEEGPVRDLPSMVVYVAKEGDSPWKVAKKYKTGVGQIREQNDLGQSETIAKGTKLLILR